jgi:hypothetical protein
MLRSDVLPQIGITMMFVSLMGLAVGASSGWSVVVTVFQQVVGIGSLLLLVGFIAWAPVLDVDPPPARSLDQAAITAARYSP